MEPVFTIAPAKTNAKKSQWKRSLGLENNEKVLENGITNPS
jgi:hypothetical protein